MSTHHLLECLRAGYSRFDVSLKPTSVTLVTQIGFFVRSAERK